MCKIIINARGEMDPAKVSLEIADEIRKEIRKVIPDAIVDVNFISSGAAK